MSDLLAESLAPFLSANPEATYQWGEPQSTIGRPWGDASIKLMVDPSGTALIDALNNVRLPPRFSAIWHRNTKRLEFIYTILPETHILRSRSFDFAFNGSVFKCRFGDASAELRAIACAVGVAGPPSSTMHRNLPNLAFHYSNTERADRLIHGVPTSFWMEPIEWDDNTLAELAGHVNFYMAYFDWMSPWITIHEETPPGLVKEERYPRGPFPSHINGHPLDSHLLLVWQSLRSAPDAFRKFLYAYQILEYRAFYYIQDKIMQAVKSAIARPDAIARIDEITRQVVDTLADHRMNDDQKLNAVIRECVNPRSVWTEIELNLQYFTREITFDGGLVLEPLLAQTATTKTFEELWGTTKFPDAIRKIRNSLVHGRESRVAVSIAPTLANHERLRPWIGPIIITAQEAMILDV